MTLCPMSNVTKDTVTKLRRHHEAGVPDAIGLRVGLFFGEDPDDPPGPPPAAD